MEEIDYLLAGGLNEGLVVQREYGTERIDIGQPGQNRVTTYTVVPPIHYEDELYAIAIYLHVSEDHLKMLIRNTQIRPIPHYLR